MHLNTFALNVTSHNWVCASLTRVFDQMKKYSHVASKPRDLKSTSVFTLQALWRGCQSWPLTRNWDPLISATYQLSKEHQRHSEEWYICITSLIHTQPWFILIKPSYLCSNFGCDYSLQSARQIMMKSTRKCHEKGLECWHWGTKRWDTSVISRFLFHFTHNCQRLFDLSQ